MAFVCYKEKGSCETCPHFRFDKGYGEKCCFAKTDEEKKLRKFFASVKEQENKYGVKINFSPENIIDGQHLDCFWYGGEVGSIEYKGFTIVIGAYGDIRLSGKINGSDVYYKDKNNSGLAFYEFGSMMDDKKLYRLLESEDENNHLRFESGNWFEVNVIAPDGKWCDLGGWDNVLENNILECFRDVSSYFEYVDNII